MRSPIWIALLAVVVAVLPVDAQPPAKKDEPKLKIGDPAPPLTVGQWHQGPEVKAFEKDKVYVVVFWEMFSLESTTILHTLNALHSKHKDCIPVAVSPAPEKKEKGSFGSTFDEEAKFVKGARPKYTFAFANDPERATKKAYGVTDSHALYVIGKDGKIAFVAPSGGESWPTDFLSDVLPKVLDGSWKGQKDADTIADAEKEFQKTLNFVAKVRALGPDFQKREPTKRGEAMSKIATESLKEMDEFLKAHPSFAGQTRTLIHRALMATLSGQKEVAVKAVDAVIADALARGTVKEAAALARFVAERQFEGELSPDVNAVKLVGAILEAVLKAPAESVEVTEHIGDLLEASLHAGLLEKGRAIIDKAVASAPADIPPERVAEMKKQELQDFEAQVKRLDEERKKRKK